MKCTLSSPCSGHSITRQNIHLSNVLQTGFEPRALWALWTVFILWKYLSPVPWCYSPFPCHAPSVTSKLLISQVREMKYLRPHIISAEMCDLRSTALNSANDIYMQITVRYTFELKEWCRVRSESRCAFTKGVGSDVHELLIGLKTFNFIRKQFLQIWYFLYFVDRVSLCITITKPT
jgi:hypothetical protein